METYVCEDNNKYSYKSKYQKISIILISKELQYRIHEPSLYIDLNTLVEKFNALENQVQW